MNWNEGKISYKQVHILWTGVKGKTHIIKCIFCELNWREKLSKYTSFCCYDGRLVRVGPFGTLKTGPGAAAFSCCGDLELFLQTPPGFFAETSMRRVLGSAPIQCTGRSILSNWSILNRFYGTFYLCLPPSSLPLPLPWSTF